MQYRDYVDRIFPQVSNVILTLALLSLMFSDLFFLSHSNEVLESSHAGFSPYFSPWLSSFDLHAPWAVLLSAVVVLVVCVLMLWMNELFSFISVRTILPALFFVVTASLVMRPHAFSVSYVVVLLMAIAIFTCFKMCEYSQMEAPIRLFNLGLLMGLLSLVSFSIVTYALVLIPFLYQIKSLSLRTVLAFVMGLLLPYVYVFIASAYVENLSGNGVADIAWIDYIQDWELMGEYSLWGQMSLSAKIYLCVMGSLFLFSLVRAFLSSATQTVKNRIETLLLCYLLLWTMFLLVIGVSDGVLLLPLFLFLGSFLMGQFLSSDYNLLTKILWGVFVLSSLLYYIFPNYKYVV